MLRFTSEFGKGSGGSTTLLSSGKLAWVGLVLWAFALRCRLTVRLPLSFSQLTVNPNKVGEKICSNTPQAIVCLLLTIR